MRSRAVQPAGLAYIYCMVTERLYTVDVQNTNYCNEIDHACIDCGYT